MKYTISIPGEHMARHGAPDETIPEIMWFHARCRWPNGPNYTVARCVDKDVQVFQTDDPVIGGGFIAYASGGWDALIKFVKLHHTRGDRG